MRAVGEGAGDQAFLFHLLQQIGAEVGRDAERIEQGKILHGAEGEGGENGETDIHGQSVLSRVRCFQDSTEKGTAQGGEGMSEKEQTIIRNFEKSIPLLSEQGKERLLAFSEGMAQMAGMQKKTEDKTA